MRIPGAIKRKPTVVNTFNGSYMVIMRKIVAVVLTMSATVAMAYNEAGPTALGGTATNAPVCSSEKPQKA